MSDPKEDMFVAMCNASAHYIDWDDCRAILAQTTPALVAEAVAAERAECALLADKQATLSESDEFERGWCRAGYCIANDIRNRSKT